MIPTENELMFCIMKDGCIADGAFGLAIGATEQEAWDRLNGGEPQDIERSIEYGASVRRCAIMVINP